MNHVPVRHRMPAETAHFQLLWTVNAPQVTITAVLQAVDGEAHLLLLDGRGVLAREPFRDVCAAGQYAAELRLRFVAKGWTCAPPPEGALALAALVA